MYDICFSLSDLFHSVWQSLSPSKSLQMTQLCFFLWLSSIPLCIYMYHIFIIQSSGDGHLGCFHVLAGVNSTATPVLSFLVLSGIQIWNSEAAPTFKVALSKISLWSEVQILHLVIFSLYNFRICMLKFIMDSILLFLKKNLFGRIFETNYENV